MVLTFFTLVALTFASEDLACVTAGVLIAQGTVPGSVARRRTQKGHPGRQ